VSIAWYDCGGDHLPQIVKDYVGKQAQAEQLFCTPSADTRVWSGAWGIERDALVDALIQMAHRWSLPMSMASLGALRDARTAVVVGGQQAGLFGGPLMTLIKAAHVVHRARIRTATTGRVHVPVFWIAGDDHDWDEVHHMYGVAQDRLTKVVLQRSSDDVRKSVSHIVPTRDAWDACIAAMANTLPESEFRSSVVQWMHDMAADVQHRPPSLVAVCARVLHHFFGAQGLIVLDAHDRALRTLQAPLFSALIAHNEAVVSAIHRGTHAVSASGYDVQVPLQPSCMHVFVAHEEVRTLLFAHGADVCRRDGTCVMTRDALMHVAQHAPWLLSPQALTRPIVQQFALPVAEVVVGGSELAYWAQLAPLFALFGLRMPDVVVRPSKTLIEPAVSRIAARWGYTVADVYARGVALRDDLCGTADALHRVEAMMHGVRAQYAAMRDALADIQTGLLDIAATNERKVIEQLAFLQHKVTHALQVKHEATLRQWDRVMLSIMPDGVLQERIHHVVTMMAKYGNDAITEAFVALADRTPMHV
jgi:bacillithiol biosynthesis cysteine-adding enzyme BshC